MEERLWTIFEQFPVAVLVLVVVVLFMRYIRERDKQAIGRDERFAQALDNNTAALHDVAEAVTALRERANGNNHA